MNYLHYALSPGVAEQVEAHFTGLHTDAGNNIANHAKNVIRCRDMVYIGVALLAIAAIATAFTKTAFVYTATFGAVSTGLGVIGLLFLMRKVDPQASEQATSITASYTTFQFRRM